MDKEETLAELPAPANAALGFWSDAGNLLNAID
jgi:hypothetical protein